MFKKLRVESNKEIYTIEDIIIIKKWLERLKQTAEKVGLQVLLKKKTEFMTTEKNSPEALKNWIWED